MKSSILLGLIFLSNLVSSQSEPDYAEKLNWAYLPGDSIVWPQYVERGPLADSVDVFFLYPTLLVKKEDTRMNFNIDDSSHRANVVNNVVKMQASAWASAGNLYVPYYRQAHIRAFKNMDENGKEALLLAYSDVKNAFQYYLDHYNNGRAIILAGHSQGSVMLGELLKDFFDGKPLKEQLVAAYLPGAGIELKKYETISLMTHPDSIGGFVTWNTFKKNYDHPNYHNWYEGKAAINPVTWDTTEVADRKIHRGFLFSNGIMYENSFSTHLIDGAIWISTPHFPYRTMAFTMDHYHAGDVNLFWEDIRENSLRRAYNYFK